MPESAGTAPLWTGKTNATYWKGDRSHAAEDGNRMVRLAVTETVESAKADAFPLASGGPSPGRRPTAVLAEPAVLGDISSGEGFGRP